MLVRNYFPANWNNQHNQSKRAKGEKELALKFPTEQKLIIQRWLCEKFFFSKEKSFLQQELSKDFCMCFHV